MQCAANQHGTIGPTYQTALKEADDDDEEKDEEEEDEKEEEEKEAEEHQEEEQEDESELQQFNSIIMDYTFGHIDSRELFHS